MAQTLAIREVILVSIQETMPNISIESDSHIVIQGIKDVINTPSLISNILKDIKMLTPSIRNIRFEFCNRNIN